MLGGGNNPESLEFFGKQLGKRTIEVLNTTENLGAQGSFSKNYQVASRDLMTPEEIRTMPRNRCLLMISGVVPFYSYKFDLKKHPNYALVEKEGHRPFDYERRAENNFAAFMKNVQEINKENHMEMVSTITSLITNVVNFAGGLLLLFGAVTLGTNLKDHNGPGISSGAWSIAGGVLIIAVATYFGTLTVS